MHDNYWKEYPAEEWSDAIVAAMKLGGIDPLFFVSGTELAFLQEAVVKAEALGRAAPRMFTMMHESVALNAAIGYTMRSGKPAATGVHVDVGTLHCGAAIHAAWHDRCPILMTAGTGPRAFPGSMPGARDIFINWVQEPRDQGSIVRQHTKMDHRLEHQDNPGLIVSRLLQMALSEPRGPVYLTLPREAAMQKLPGSIKFPTVEQMGLARPSWPDPEDARTVAKWLIKSENPVLFTARIGEEAAAIPEYIRLCELLAIPVAESTPLATRMNFPTTHPLYGTGPSPKDADVVLVIDDLTPFMPGVNSPAADAKIAWGGLDPVNSRYKTMEYRADLWLTASPINIARAIYEEATKILDKSDLTRIAARRERLERRKKEILAEEEKLAQESGRLAHPTGRWVAHQLGRLIDPDSIIVNDGLSNGDFIRTYARRDQFGTYFRTGSTAGGWGPGAAVGIKLAAPGKDVILPSGDGFFMFGSPLSALWAARFHKAPFLSVIFVNGVYSTGTVGVRDMYPEGYAARSGNFVGGQFEPPPDFAKLAETVGGYGESVTKSEDVAPALKRGLAQVRNGIPAIIAIRVPVPARIH